MSMPVSHFVTAYLSASPYLQVHSLVGLCLYSHLTTRFFMTFFFSPKISYICVSKVWILKRWERWGFLRRPNRTFASQRYRQVSIKMTLFPFLGFPWTPFCRLKVCSGGILMSNCSGKNVTWSFNLWRKSHPKKRGIGYSSIYKKPCFRVRTPSWHSRGCKNEQFCTSPEVPVIGLYWDVFCATLLFTTEYVAPVSIRKSINLSLLSELPRAPVGKLESYTSSLRESPGLFQDVSAREIALMCKWLPVQIGCPVGS